MLKKARGSSPSRSSGGQAEPLPQWASDKGGVVGPRRSSPRRERRRPARRLLVLSRQGGTARQARDRKSEDIGRGQIGYTETYIIDGKVAAKLSRGFRPAPAAPMFGGTEKVETFDVTDGVIGATPTSTTKSRLQYERPEVAQRTGFGRRLCDPTALDAASPANVEAARLMATDRAAFDASRADADASLDLPRRRAGPTRKPAAAGAEDALGDDLDAEDERRLALSLPQRHDDGQ
ncbi:hypothetical protein JL720_16347 [Aureococcus anophagefferens]|nr:hypothetical protein JL720_16347 [Aureococcus anophagefferens]